MIPAPFFMWTFRNLDMDNDFEPLNTLFDGLYVHTSLIRFCNRLFQRELASI